MTKTKILDTKTALLAAFVLATLDLDTGPTWYIVLKLVIRLVALVYLIFYFWVGPQPVDRHKDGQLTDGR